MAYSNLSQIFMLAQQAGEAESWATKAIAVSREAHGKGFGKAIVRAVEDLARKRGIYDVFALTLQPEFFAAIGYQRVDRARYPEKIRRDCLGCSRRFACNEICFASKDQSIGEPEIDRLVNSVGLPMQVCV